MKVYCDLFCGGGGSTTGALQALEELGVRGARCVAVNHDPQAIATHTRNHPNVEHYDCDIEALDPREVLGEDKVRVMWASAPCTEWSRAAGGPAKRPQQRATPEYILEWLRVGEPDVYIEENVWEITQKWPGWEQHLDEIRALGYRVEYRKLNAADYGTPQDRRRLILIAVRGEEPITWPRQTHSDPRRPVPGTRPWRGAIEALDLEAPCPSIFGRRRKDGSPNPHSEKTRARIARYIRTKGRFWEPLAVAVEEYTGPVPLADALEACPREEWPAWIQERDGHLHLTGIEPFMDRQYGTGRCHPITDPAGTVTTGGGRGGGHHAVVQPFILGQQGGAVGRDAEAAAPTVPTAGYVRVGELCLLDTYGSKDAWLARTRDADRPSGAVTCSGRWGIADVRCVLPPEGRYGGNVARDPDRPAPTVGAMRGAGHMVVGSVILPHHGERQGQAPRIHDTDAPAPTLPASRGLHAAFVNVYTYNGQAQVDAATEPATTVTTVERHAVLEVRIEDCLLDVGMRMCLVKELARFQGFPDHYEFVGAKGQQTRQIGNAVPVQLAKAVVRSALARIGIAERTLTDYQVVQSPMEAS